MDAAAYYGRRRDAEPLGNSGILVVVQAEDSSADAYGLLTNQIDDLRSDMHLELDYLGIVVNHYDARRGYIATSSLDSWMAIRDPRVVGLVGDLKEQKEAVRVKQPLLAYAPSAPSPSHCAPSPGRSHDQQGSPARRRPPPSPRPRPSAPAARRSATPPRPPPREPLPRSSSPSA